MTSSSRAASTCSTPPPTATLPVHVRQRRYPSTAFTPHDAPDRYNMAAIFTAAALCLSLRVCLSVCQKSVFYRNWWTHRTSSWHVGFLRPTLYSATLRVSPNITVLPSGTLSQTLDFDKFPHGKSIVSSEKLRTVALVDHTHGRRFVCSTVNVIYSLHTWFMCPSIVMLF